MIIQKSDKGNLVVAFDRNTNNKKMKPMQSDLKKIIKVDVTTYSNFSINQEKQLDRFLKSLKDKKLSAAKYHSLRLKETKPRNMYGLNKIYS